MMTSWSQNKGLHVNQSTPTNKTPPEGKTNTVIAVMRGTPKDGYHRHRSNKNDKQKLVRVLLDSGSNGNIVFVSKDKPILLPYSKRVVPQLWNTLMGSSRLSIKLGWSFTSLNILIAKRYYSELQNLMCSNTRRLVTAVWPHSWYLDHERVRYCAGLESQDNNHWWNHYANEKHQPSAKRY